MRYDFRRSGEESEWAETRDARVLSASPKLALFVGHPVETLLVWCRARKFRVYVSQFAGSAVRKIEEPNDYEEIC